MKPLPPAGRIFVAGLWLAVAGSLLVPTASAAFRYLQEGMTAPTVTGEDILSGETVTSEVGDDDGVVIVTFWATWSKRSLEILKDLKALTEELPDRPVRIIAVNVEGQAITANMRRSIASTIEEMELPYSVVIDDQLASFYEFGVIAVPSTAILDSTGALRFAPSGYSLTIRDRIRDTIEVLLGIKVRDEAIALVPGYQPVKKASRYYRLAVQMTNQRMYERALANLAPSIEADSMFSAPHNLRGQVLLALDSTSAAVAAFAEAVRLDSNSVAAWAGWGRALVRIDSLDSGYEKLAAALSRDGSYTPALLDLSLCLSGQHETDRALDSLAAARELNPREPTVHYYLGRVYRSIDRLADAFKSYRTALRILYPGH